MTGTNEAQRTAKPELACLAAFHTCHEQAAYRTRIRERCVAPSGYRAHEGRKKKKPEATVNHARKNRTRADTRSRETAVPKKRTRVGLTSCRKTGVGCAHIRTIGQSPATQLHGVYGYSVLAAAVYRRIQFFRQCCCVYCIMGGDNAGNRIVTQMMQGLLAFDYMYLRTIATNLTRDELL